MLYVLNKDFADGILTKRDLIESILNDDKNIVAKSKKFEKSIIKLIDLVSADEKLENDEPIKEFIKMIQCQFSNEILKDEAEVYCNKIGEETEQGNILLKGKRPYVSHEITLLYTKYRRLKKEAKENNMTLKKYMTYYIFEKENRIVKPVLRASLCELNERIKGIGVSNRKIEKELARLWKLL